MKTFERQKTLAEIRKQCEASGVALRTGLYELGRSDFVGLYSPKVVVLYAPHNGRFFGNTPEGVNFTSDDSGFDGTPWFDALLNFFYFGEQ